MELSRRDVLAALAAVGVGAAAGCSAPTGEADAADEQVVRTLVAVAEVVYPSTVEEVESFVRDVSTARIRANEEYEAGVVDAIGRLEAYVDEFHDVPYVELDRAERAAVLDRMGVDTADPVPDGRDRERIRYYVVNELLYAFYSTPTGASLAGLENPPGHPGGTGSYRRGPGG